MLNSWWSFTMALLMDWNQRVELQTFSRDVIPALWLMAVHATVPPLGSRTLANAGLWRGHPGCKTPAPRSESRQWTPLRSPTCCPFSGSLVYPSDGSARFQAGRQERLELLKDRRVGGQSQTSDEWIDFHMSGPEIKQHVVHAGLHSFKRQPHVTIA